MDVPLLGTLVICATLVAAAYTLAMAFGAGRGRPHLLVAARYGTYATFVLLALAVVLLAYAFESHDFRIRYVARYSDRSMAWWYLVTSLWGGQDGSLLWWSFLLGGWCTACIRWARGRYVELQPWAIATWMLILIFFQVLMLWTANPFFVTAAATPLDGEGLNPLLQNYWMAIHPPTLYMGFVGWTVPFGFVVAALITGRLHDEWIIAMRRWYLAAWLFLSVGLLLGMIWSYEELGWGGYWAWDPVENASLMPWFVATAFIHSVMVQERYGMLKLWNVFLMCLTFFMTIFGTYLTRSGQIASVHSFAKSDIGDYFIGFMVVLIVSCMALVGWRLPELRARRMQVTDLLMGFLLGGIGFLFVVWGYVVQFLRDRFGAKAVEGPRPPRIESLLSREFAFLLNNWILLAMMVFVVGLTMFPMISAELAGETVTVGPPVYNRWMIPFGIVLMMLKGIGPLISWRKATGKHLARAFFVPVVAGLAAGGAHVLFGDALGFPAWVESPEIYDNTTAGAVLRVMYGIGPTCAFTACAFVTASLSQEFWRGTRVRMRSKGEAPLLALARLMGRSRRRYGGYIAHLAVVAMFIGFTGAAYDVEKEGALRPGEILEVGTETLLRGRYRLRYEGARVTSDENRQMVFGDLALLDDRDQLQGTVSPAKFTYRTHPQMPTTEVAMRIGIVEDLYVIMNSADSRAGMGTFRVIVRPGVLWVWIGGMILVLGTVFAMFPTIAELFGRAPVRNTVVAALAALAFASGLALPSGAEAQDSSSLHAGAVEIRNPEERLLFERLLCMCGGCQRLTLATCACGWAVDARTKIRRDLANETSVEQIQVDYRAEHGAAALSIPPDEGLGRAMWAVPLGAGVLAMGGVFWLGLIWRKRGRDAREQPADTSETQEHYDRMLDDELERLEGE